MLIHSHHDRKKNITLNFTQWEQPKWLKCSKKELIRKSVRFSTKTGWAGHAIASQVCLQQGRPQQSLSTHPSYPGFVAEAGMPYWYLVFTFPLCPPGLVTESILWNVLMIDKRKWTKINSLPYNNIGGWSILTTASSRTEVGKLGLVCQMQPAACFLYSPWDKNGFYIVKWWRKKREEYFLTCKNYRKLKFQCPWIKFCWNTAMFTHLYLIYNSFHAAMAELNSCYRDPMACKAKTICYLVL